MAATPVPKGCENVEGGVNKYMSYFEYNTESNTARKNEYATCVNTFYDLVTDFYEYGWGQSFHFAPRATDETFKESMRRHEYYMALRLGLNSKTTCLDLGCGVGGPAMNIARMTGSKIIGINNNGYQVQKATRYVENGRLSGLVEVKKADFMNLPFEDNFADGAYECEATCHSPDRTACYAEIQRVLKPGAIFCGYEWALTDEFDPKNSEHVRIREGIETGNGIAPLITVKECHQHLMAAGFEVVEVTDHAQSFPGTQMPWYHSLEGSFSIESFKHTRLGRGLTHMMCSAMETLRIFPKGTTGISSILMMTADCLVEGGQLGIFTPCLFHMGRKPTVPKSLKDKVEDEE